MFNFKGENCASFIEKMSHKKNLACNSISNKIFGLNNPSSTKSNYYTSYDLNKMINNIILEKNEETLTAYSG